MVREVREDYRNATESYRTPTACSRALLPRAGAGHTMVGIWPPKDVPPYVWQTLQDYTDADRWGVAVVLEVPDSWTMTAFRILDQTANEIRVAHREAEERKRRRSN